MGVPFLINCIRQDPYFFSYSMYKDFILPERNSGRMSGLNPSGRSSVQTLLHGVEGGGRQHEHPAQLSLQPGVVVDLHQPLPQPTVQPLARPVQ